MQGATGAVATAHRRYAKGAAAPRPAAMCAGSTKIAAPTVILKMAAASPRTPMTRRSAGSAAAGTGAAMPPRYRKGGPSLRAPLLSSYLARASEPVIPSLRSGQALSAAGAQDLLFGP